METYEFKGFVLHYPFLATLVVKNPLVKAFLAA